MPTSPPDPFYSLKIGRGAYGRSLPIGTPEDIDRVRIGTLPIQREGHHVYRTVVPRQRIEADPIAYPEALGVAGDPLPGEVLTAGEG